MDNAIQACIKEKNVHPEIVIAVRRRHHFLIAEVTNTKLPENYTFEYGTGLENIKHIVEKYEGTMEIETSENCFRLSILLCLLPFANME
ncbi:GHKL domain-containing protein [Sporofaciens sp. JLR.KK001]|uniref:GHKL domain-containing protein n=1 Tax=Sporofaciens sp. JLR.KK001 TaxID=3112621 RepID=UPI002FF1E9CB